jgi:hypothetical protein
MLIRNPNEGFGAGQAIGVLVLVAVLVVIGVAQMREFTLPQDKGASAIEVAEQQAAPPRGRG